MYFKTFRKNRSIRFKFTVVFAGFVAMILLLFSVMVYLVHSHRIYQSMRKALSFAIEQSIQNFFDQEAGFHLHKREIESEYSQFISIQIYDQNEVLLYNSHPLLPELEKEDFFFEYKEVMNGKYLVHRKIVNTNFSQYIICGFYLQTVEKKDLQELIFIIFFFIVGTILLTIVGAWYLAFKLLAPFRTLAENASRIHSKNLNEKLEYSLENDEVGQLSVTLNSVFSRLRNSFESLKKFTSNASHELKTPLTIMKGDIEVLLRKKRNPEEYEETLQCTIEELDRMFRLVQNLLLLAQAEGEKLMDATLLNLEDLIDSSLENTMRLYSGQITRIEKNMDSHCSVFGNPIWIQQIIENLLNNAFQNTPSHGKISISMREANNFIEVEIKNSDSQIASEHLPFIFDRFYRIHSDRLKSRGFGLGLSICKALAEAHRGFIKVENLPQKEVAFTLCLPK